MRCVTDDPRLDLTIGFPRRAAGASSTARHVVDRGGFVNGRPFAPLMAKITGTDQATFEDLAGKAKAGCPVSKLFNADITLDATLES